MVNGWKYYNHAVIPDCAPHEEPDLISLNDGSIWKEFGKKCLLARWTSDFDCNRDTGWYYVIKDTPLLLEELNAKKRYEINKGNKFFDVRDINSEDCNDELYNVHCVALSTYGNVKVPDKGTFISNMKRGLTTGYKILGAYFKEDNKLCGYLLLKVYDTHVNLISQKAVPEYEKKAVNAALVFGACEYYREELANKTKYLCDGEKSILHETAFQGYLERYFLFRKAYCKLNVRYRPFINGIVTILYPFRKIIYKINFLNKVSSVLKMQEIVKLQSCDKV